MLTPVYHNPALPAPEMTVLNATLNLLFRTPADHLTMTQVYKAAGVSKSTLYQYFSSKPDLWAAVLIEEARSRLHELQSLPAVPTRADWTRWLFETLQSPQKHRILASLEKTVNSTNETLPRKDEWRRLEYEVQSQVMDCLRRTLGNQALSEARIGQRWALWQCILSGWLMRYREPEFQELIGERKPFALYVAEQGAEVLCRNPRELQFGL